MLLLLWERRKARSCCCRSDASREAGDLAATASIIIWLRSIVAIGLIANIVAADRLQAVATCVAPTKADGSAWPGSDHRWLPGCLKRCDANCAYRFAGSGVCAGAMILRTPVPGTKMMTKPYSPACERNQGPILDQLCVYFADRRSALEIGSGTGQHAVHVAAGMPWLQWQCSDHVDYLPGIRMWLDEAALPNTPVPFALHAVLDPQPGLAPPPSSRYDAVFSANTLHIMGWPEVQALFTGLRRVLADDAVLVVYGPFNDNGAFTSDSNREFDASLKARDPRSGLRDFEAVNALAEAIGLRLVADIVMPANNRTLVWRRGEAG
jgi:hypothetical protein